MITWRTGFKNSPRKFLRCAIGARKIQAKIIPAKRKVSNFGDSGISIPSMQAELNEKPFSPCVKPKADFPKKQTSSWCS